MGRLFGTDGIRGVANETLTAQQAFDIGRAGAYVLTKECSCIPKVMVGMDTRVSGDMLESALVAGMCSVGAHVICAGIIPTPAVAYLVRKHKCDAGVVISASHNPFEDNGIKFFSSEGYKLKDEYEEEIEDIYFNHLSELPAPKGRELGAKLDVDGLLDDYLEFVKSTVGVNFENMKVVVDCANGAGYKAAPILFSELKADANVLYNEPDGFNINAACGSTHIESLVASVKEHGADIGIALDGDGDRCLLVDENGSVVDGDHIMSICAMYLKQKDSLAQNTIVATVMSNLGLFMMAKQNNINIETAKVGDRYVLEMMLEKGYVLGGEQSGHIIFLNYNPTGDGLLTAVQVLSVMKNTGKKLSELASIMQVMPQVLVNAVVNNAKKNSYMENDEIKSEIEALEAKFSGDGRVLIRPSGTEPLIRVMIEGKNKDEMQAAAEKLCGLMEKILK